MTKKTVQKSYPAYNGFNHVGYATHSEQLSKNAVILFLTSFLIPGLGLSADNCMKKVLSAISSLGNAAKFISKHCERIQCPNCYQWWISKRAFELSVLIECYALYVNDRPAGVMCSIHPDKVKDWTWNDYCKFIRKCYSRMYKLGITGGVRVFHPFRVKDEIKIALKKLGAKDSGGFWKMIRENVLNLPFWYSYVYLAPHIHNIVFPSFIEPNTTKDIVIRKYAVFATVRDTVAHVRYLLSHCGVLTDGENEPATPFGVLHGWKPEEHLTLEQITNIKIEVATAMGLAYNADKDTVEPVNTEKDEKYEWIPIHEFADYSAEQCEYINAFISSIPDHQNMIFVNDLIGLYNERRQNMELESHDRYVFLDDVLKFKPDGFEIVITDNPNEVV